MNWVIGKKQKRRNRIKAQFGKNPMELEAWESLEKRMREIRMYEELVVQDLKELIRDRGSARRKNLCFLY